MVLSNPQRSQRVCLGRATHSDRLPLIGCSDPLQRAGEKLERSVESLPVLPITLEEVEERTVRWRVRRETRCARHMASSRAIVQCPCCWCCLPHAVGVSIDLISEVHSGPSCVVGLKITVFAGLLCTPIHRMKRLGSDFPLSIQRVAQDLSRKHGIPPERLGSMQAQLRVELDELVVAAEALPLAREKEERWRMVVEQATGELSAARRRCGVCMYVYVCVCMCVFV